jgi:hypothetical protein
VLAALQIINDGISNDSVDKQSSGSTFSSFGPTSFSGVYNVKDYQIFNSTLGRLVPEASKLEESLLSLGGEAKGTFAHEGVDPRP